MCVCQSPLVYFQQFVNLLFSSRGFLFFTFMNEVEGPKKRTNCLHLNRNFGTRITGILLFYWLHFDGIATSNAKHWLFMKEKLKKTNKAFYSNMFLLVESDLIKAYLFYLILKKKICFSRLVVFVLSGLNKRILLYVKLWCKCMIFVLLRFHIK